MLKHYHTVVISLIAVLAIGLAVGISPRGLAGGGAGQGVISSAMADEDEHRYGEDGYDEEGYDRDGHDREGFNHEGYSHDGHHRDGHYNEEHDQKKHPSTGGGSDQPFTAKPKVKQY